MQVNSQPPLAWLRLGRSIKMVLVSSQYVAEEISMKGDIGGSVSKEQSPDFLAHRLEYITIKKYVILYKKRNSICW